MDKLKSPKYNNALSVETPLRLKENLVVINNVSYLDQLNETVNAYSVYELERNTSNLYTFSFFISPYFSNRLFNLTGENSYDSVLEQMNYIEEENKYQYAQDEILKEYNGWYFYLSGLSSGDTCQINYLYPDQSMMNLITADGDENWSIYLTYPKENSQEFSMGDYSLEYGLPIYSGSTVTIDSKEMTALYSYFPHNLTNGDRVVVSYSGDSKTLFVYKTGDLNNEENKNVFIIDDILDTQYYSGTFKRKVDTISSDYYLTKLYVISDITNLIRAGFSKNIYGDENIISYIKDEIDISTLVDGFNIPISKVYVTFLKNNKIPEDIFYFTPILEGVNITRPHPYNISTLTTQNLLNIRPFNTDFFYGQIIERNNLEQKTYTLADIYHRFNTVNRENMGYYEGYYYKASYPISIKEFEEYVEESSSTSLIPDYAHEYNTNRYFYRPLKTNTDADLYPFLNGKHYVTENISFYLLTQDPCGENQMNPLEIFDKECYDFSTKSFKIISEPC